MVEILRNEGNLVGIRLSGKLHDADYKQFVPVIEAAAQKGKLHLLIDMQDFHGWDMPALWDDMKLEPKLGGQIEAIAFIGDKKWQEWMATICRPFTRAQVQYFDAHDTQNAWAWVQDGL